MEKFQMRLYALKCVQIHKEVMMGDLIRDS